MDTFAHGLWTGVSYEALKRNSKRPINVSLSVFWGVFPDFFAFTIPFIYMFGSVLFGRMSLSNFRPHTQIEPVAHQFPFYDLANSLYNVSHSLFVFTLVFVIVALMRKKVMWELGAWLLHILIDVPTHSYQFFPTPFLWPISDFRVNGFLWATPTFIAVNYTLILVSLVVLYLTRLKIKQE